MKNGLILAAIFTVALTGCSKRSSSGTDSMDLNASFREKVMAATPLTPELKQEATTYLKPLGDKLPDLDLMTNEIESGANRESALASLDSDGRKYLNLIQTKCQIEPGRDEVISSSGSGGPGSKETVRRTTRVQGTDCPVSITETTTTTNQLISINQRARTGSMSSRIVTESVEQITDPNLQALTGMVERRNKMQVKLRMNNVKVDNEGNVISGKIAVKMSSEMRMKTTSGITIPLTIEAEAAGKTSNVNAAILMNARFPSGVLQIAVFKKGDNTEVFLNGQPSTMEEIQENFGAGFEDGFENVQ